jgi:hypothetical protein
MPVILPEKHRILEHGRAIGHALRCENPLRGLGATPLAAEAGQAQEAVVFSGE